MQMRKQRVDGYEGSVLPSEIFFCSPVFVVFNKNRLVTKKASTGKGEIMLGALAK